MELGVFFFYFALIWRNFSAFFSGFPHVFHYDQRNCQNNHTTHTTGHENHQKLQIARANKMRAKGENLKYGYNNSTTFCTYYQKDDILVNIECTVPTHDIWWVFTWCAKESNIHCKIVPNTNSYMLIMFVAVASSFITGLICGAG